MATNTYFDRYQAHCENCGRTDHESLNNGDQGYTACCNECVCKGNTEYKFGTLSDNVRACCWAGADAKFADQGRRAPEGSSRHRLGSF